MKVDSLITKSRELIYSISFPTPDEKVMLPLNYGIISALIGYGTALVVYELGIKSRGYEGLGFKSIEEAEKFKRNMIITCSTVAFVMGVVGGAIKAAE